MHNIIQPAPQSFSGRQHQSNTTPGNPNQDANGNTNHTPNRRETTNPYANALLSLHPGDSFTIRKENKLRSNVRRMARYYNIPIITKAESPDEIRVWRTDPTKYVARQRIKLSRDVPPPPKPTDVIEVIKLREAKAKARKAPQNATQKVELVNNERQILTLVIVDRVNRAAV